MKSLFFFSLACHTAKCSETQKQMSVKVISWGHKMGIAEVFFLFFFSLLYQAFIIISSMSCKHQMPQTSATSTVSERPPTAPWDICIYFLSPGCHCSPSICRRWLGSCLLGLIAASQSWLSSCNSNYRSLRWWSYFSCDFKKMIGVMWPIVVYHYSFVSIVFASQWLWIMFLFPQDHCFSYTVLWVAFMEQLHCSWFGQGRSDLTHVSALKTPLGKPTGPPPFEEVLCWAHVPSSIKALLFMPMLIRPSSRHVPIN